MARTAHIKDIIAMEIAARDPSLTVSHRDTNEPVVYRDKQSICIYDIDIGIMIELYNHRREVAPALNSDNQHGTEYWRLKYEANTGANMRVDLNDPESVETAISGVLQWFKDYSGVDKEHTK